MPVGTRTFVILAVCLAMACGCALSPKPQQAQVPLTQEQIDWWAANQHRKQYVPGKGYYIEGVSGFFDHDGRKLASDMSPAKTEEDPSVLEKISPKKAMAKLKKAVGKGPNEQIARSAMEEGDSLFRQKQYVQAADKYRLAYKRWPDSPLEEEAIYKAGESEFFADRYYKADDEYMLLVKKFAATQFLSQVTIRRFSIGRYWEQYDQAHPHWPVTANWTDKTRPLFDTGGHALRVFERIRLDDPVGPLADDAVMASANAHFVRGHWEEADYHYGLLRTEFPKSDHQFQAHLLGLRCKLLRYQGPGYEGAPLDQAEELATQLLTQFPNELGKEQDRVLQVRAEIRSQRALRVWDIAEYYTRGQYYGAARIYYAKVVKEYPDTRLAQESRSRLEQFQDLPSVPAQHFTWLVNLFPESKREGPVLSKNYTNVASGPSATTRQ